MNLGQLIERLKQENPNREIPIGFCNPHSHRGDYSELAFDVELDTDIRSLLSAAEYAVDRDFEGYKGGVYRMTMETECYLTVGKAMCGINIDTALLDQLLFVNPISDDCVIVHKDYISRLLEKQHDTWQTFRDRVVECRYRGPDGMTIEKINQASALLFGE